MDKKEMEHLAWFLGPKAENAPFLEELLLLIFRDYLHWRKNYFPGDKILINKSMQREFEDDHDRFSQNVHEMMAELRRNFPFYSPRYIAHMLADTALPSVLGYIAGMLYNPNNVTPEAAPVTVDWEIEAANEILKMIGYVQPPPPPPPLSEESATDYYGRMAKGQFGWAHITMGGTTANVEALWIARAVKYFPLSVRDIAIEHDLDLTVKLPDGTQKRLGELSEKQALLLKPNESIYLLSRYVDAVRRKHEMPPTGASDPAWDLLKASPYSLSKGTGSLFSKHRPLIFVSGAAHYSIRKAADVLGIGKDNVVIVKMDSMFRMDVADLEERMLAAVREGHIPLAVVAIVGTTEEGAVDPVHEILDLRDRLQQQHNISFWLHVDSAWGGYIRSLFTFEQADVDGKILARMAKKFGFRGEQDPTEWHRVLTQVVEERIREEAIQEKDKGKGAAKKDERTRKRIEGRLTALNNVLLTGNSGLYLKALKKLVLERTFIFSEVNSAPLTTDSISDWPALLAWLKAAGGEGRPLAEAAVKSCLSRREQKYVDSYTQNQPIDSVAKRRIVDGLNKLLNSIVFSSEEHFSGVEIPEEAQRLLKQGVDNLPTNDLRRLNKLLFLSVYHDKRLCRPTIKESDFRLGLQGRVELINDFVQDEVEMEFDSYHNRIRLVWGTKEVCSAFIAIPKANSVTIDPHKLGYLTYPCGVVAFQNDRVRHFVMQKAPYITSSKHNALIHVPPKHADLTGQDSGKPNVFIDSFGPFILEGSRPGAAAAALWLTTKTIPLSMRKHGAILRSSLLAARELYEWLNRWDSMMQTNGIDTDYQFIPLTPDRPDTNVVIFVCKKKTSTRVGAINKLTRGVYDRFAIQTELGERKYSYAQPFFLSKTLLEEPEYQYSTLENFFEAAQLTSAKKDYQKEGLVVLRATVMNPYLYPMKHFTGQNFAKEFLEELGAAARESVKEV